MGVEEVAREIQPLYISQEPEVSHDGHAVWTLAPALHTGSH